MRFFSRAISGMALWLVTLACVAAAGWTLHSAISDTEGRKSRPSRERAYSVDTATLQQTTVTPVITAHGQVRAWNSLEIRAPASGPVTEISDNFRDGMTVTKGELLFRVDPDMTERRVTDARAALEQSETERAEAAQTEAHIEAEIAAAKAEVEVRRGDLGRKKALFAKRLTTSTIRDDAVLSLSAAEQKVVAKERELLALKGRITKAEAGVARAKLVLSDAERLLKDTAYRAPYTGRLSEVTLTLGRRVSENEKLGVLIDPDALEVSFPVRNSEFGRLIDPNNKQKLAPLPAKVTLDLAGQSVTATAVLDRPAAVASTVAGRTIYARITGGEVLALRPGDFVTVAVQEPALSNVAVIPADAASLKGELFLVGKDGRLVEHQGRIVRRQNDELIVAGVPFGEDYVVRRLPFLSRGTAVTSRNAAGQPESTAPVADAAKSTTVATSIDAKHRAALIAFVKARTDIPQRRRERLLRELQKPVPEQRIVDRIERRMARMEQRS